MAIDWARRRAIAAALPRLAPFDGPMPEGETLDSITARRNTWVTHAASDIDVDERAEQIRTVTDPIRVLAIVATHRMPKRFLS